MGLLRDLKDKLRRFEQDEPGPSPDPAVLPVPRVVFCHYMVGGIEPHQARRDVQQAAAMGCDGFILNVMSTADWSANAIRCLFDAAADTAFRLCFSFDMLHFADPAEFLPLLTHWLPHHSYFLIHGRPFVTTFGGGKLSFGAETPNEGWEQSFRQPLAASGIHPYFVPAFSDADCAPHDFFDTFSVADGVMNWESWPWEHEGRHHVSCEADSVYHRAAQRAHKTFMMGISPLQFKRISPEQHWFRRGSLTLTHRMSQVLQLSPSFVQIQTWNDAGESHYIGNLWPYAIPSDSPTMTYVEGFDHSGWRIILASFITAYKQGLQDVSDLRPAPGKGADGTFWYGALADGAACDNDSWGPTRGIQNVDHDEICVAVVLDPSQDGATTNVWSGHELLATLHGHPGLNSWSVRGKRPGPQLVEIFGPDGTLLARSAPGKSVLEDGETHNYNYHVVPLSRMECGDAINERS